MTQSCSLIPECKKGNKFLLSYRKAVRVARWLRWWSSLCWMCSGRPPVWDALIWIYWWAGRGMLDLMPSGTFLMLRCPLPGLSASFLGLGLGVHLSGGPLPQLRPLFLLSLADFLGAAVLISTMAVHLLPSQLFGAAYGFCLYGLMFGMMFYAISLLMVLVYACEVNRAVRGWRVTQHSNLQENSSCFPRCQLALPYALAWLIPCLVVLALLVLSNGPLRRTALLQPLSQGDNDSSGGSNLSCSSCLVLIHLSQDTCLKPQSAGSGPAVQGDREQGHSLSPQHLAKESSIVFLVFVALVVSGCMVLYCRVNSWHRQDCYVPRSDGLARRSHVTRRFQLVLVLCWMPACLLVLLSFTSLQLSSLFPVSVATGFLHSLAYGWLRGNFRRELAGERLPLHCSPGLKAFYEDSLAGPC
ncbi:uncharacterized protein PHA67_023605 isoform 2-T2 [Liasis olivaceus]